MVSERQTSPIMRNLSRFIVTSPSTQGNHWKQLTEETFETIFFFNKTELFLNIFIIKFLTLKMNHSLYMNGLKGNVIKIQIYWLLLFF